MDRPPMQRVLPFLVAMAMFAAVVAAPAGAADDPAETAGDTSEAPAIAERRPRRLPTARAGELIVRVRPTAGERGLTRALDRADAHAVSALGRGLSLVRVAPGQERAAAARLTADPAIVYAEPNYVRTADAHDWSETNWGIRSTGAPALWARTTPLTGRGVRVAILDSGVDGTHPQLRANIVTGFDAYGEGGRDDCGHGTAVAGVVGAVHDGQETVGVAPDATIVPVRVLRFDRFYGVCGGDDASIIRGIAWAADPLRGNADVINMSLSGPQSSPPLREAIDAAAEHGVLVVAASGNSGDRTVNYPAAYPSVVSVGGVQRVGGDIRAWPHASFGAVDIAAPAKAVPVLIAKGVQSQPGRIARPCGDIAPWCSDGTSFAAPHVAGVAALLYQQHPELASMSPAVRLQRLRQWILGTARRVDGAPAGVDLRTGHGRPDAVRAADTSTDAAATLVTWESGRRVIAPRLGMAGTPARLPMSLTATSGTGVPLRDQPVAFRTPAGGSLDSTTARTNARGIAWTTLRSTIGSRVARVTGTVAGRSLPFAVYVLHRDDNVPGVVAPATAFRGSLNVATDVDDVYRFKLYDSETLRATVTGVESSHEQVVLYLHRGTTRDVTDPFRAPLREDAGYAEDPRRLSRTVQSDGVRYLDVYGFGTYRLRWWILVPGAVRDVAASPAVFSPDGDGYRDRTRLSWHVARRGTVTLSIRNGAGTVVRRVAFGTQAAGVKAFRWNGRTTAGRPVRDGVYRAAVRWSNGRGRVWTSSTKVTVAR